ncbi:efflux RND transporter permease subunit [Proteobacteria bacterium 005FR1]|nr:efflux RND transporter permease subunit [Proteobacteria bacterium 005FR1]
MPMTEGAIKRPITTTMLFLIIIALGIIGFRFLPVGLLPAIEFPQINVQVSYPNVGPEEMERLVTEPLENALSGVADVEQVESNSQEGSSWVTLRFAQGVDLNEATNEVREALDRVRNSLPEDASVPRIRKFDPDAMPIIILGAQSERSLVDLTRVLEREIRRRFEQISGVGAIDVWGGIENEIRVDVHRDRLLATNLTINDIIQALGSENTTLPGGNVQRGLADVYVRSLGEYSDVGQIRQTVVRVIDGVPLRVEDIADVEYTREDVGRYIEVDDRPMLRLGIRKQSGANTIAVAEDIRREVERINASRNDLQLLVIDDQSVFIQDSIDNVRNSAIWGGILAVIILFAFLRSGSTTAIIAMSIPIAVIATFSLLYFGGLTLNQMSFGGLALGVGLIVDNAIVVIENIVRQRQIGRNPHESASVGTRQVGGAIIASTITTSVIFLPIVFMQTITGALFKEFAAVVVFALMCSLLVALTLVPMLASRFLTIDPQAEGKKHGILHRLEQWYESFLVLALRRRGVVFLTVAAMVGASLFGLQFLSSELAPTSEAEVIDIDMDMDEGTNIAIIHSYMMELDRIVQGIIPHDDVKHYTREISNGSGEVELTMVSLDQRGTNADELADRIRKQVQTAIPGAQIRVRTRSGMNMMNRMFRSGGEDSLRIELRGYDLQTAEQVAMEIRDRMLTISVIADARSEQSERQPEQTINFDRERMATVGISINDVGRAIQASVGGSRAGVFREHGDEVDITVRLRPEDRLNVQDVDNISVRAADGSVVPVSALIRIDDSRAPNSIRRIDSQRVTYIDANLQSGVALGDAIGMIQQELNQMSLPEGFSIVYGGEYEEQQKAQKDFILAIAMAIVLIYMVMAAQFERFLDPFIVMFSVPLAIIGVVPALLLTNTSLNMQSLMGVVMLVGIVVNNAIVLVDYINLMRREEGLEVAEAVRRAARLRLRPILMTTLTTILGLLPLAIGLGAGAEMQASLARVVIGGLSASSLITLVFIPVVYVTAHSIRDRLATRVNAIGSATPPDNV